MRRHLLPHRPGLLPALGLGREGDALHLHPGVAHCVLPAAGRDHPADVAGRAVTREVSALHHDPRHFVHISDGGSAERPLQVGCASLQYVVTQSA